MAEGVAEGVAGGVTASAISMFMAKHTNTTTSFTMTTAMINEAKGPLPSVSFSTAIYTRQVCSATGQPMSDMKDTPWPASCAQGIWTVIYHTDRA